MRIKVGDSVICYLEEARYVGTVVAIDASGACNYLVHSKDFVTVGHDGIYKGYIQPNNNNYWLDEEDLELVGDPLGKIDGEMQDLYMKLHYILKEECRDKSDEYCEEAEEVKELLSKAIDALQVLLAYEDSREEGK